LSHSQIVPVPNSRLSLAVSTIGRSGHLHDGLTILTNPIVRLLSCPPDMEVSTQGTVISLEDFPRFGRPEDIPFVGAFLSVSEPPENLLPEALVEHTFGGHRGGGAGHRANSTPRRRASVG
jgi:hypothetical protein